MTAYPKVVEVHVHRLDSDIYVRAFAERATVRDVKCFIDETVNIPCECQRLFDDMYEVTDDETLGSIVGQRRRRRRLLHKLTRILDLDLVQLPNVQEEIAHRHILEAIDTGAEISGRHYINRPEWRDSLVILSPDIQSIPSEIGDFASKCPKEITIRNCPRLTTLPVEFFDLSGLLRLTIWSCRRLLRIPPEIRYLTALRVLRIDNCQSITHIPDEMFDMTNLVCLTLCRLNVVVPSRIGCLHKLQCLTISYIAGITHVPLEIGRLPVLCMLEIHGCTNLTCLPDEVDCFPSLECLSVMHCPVLTRLPSCARSLQRLRSLTVGFCFRVSRIPANLERLRELDLAHCFDLTQIPERITDSMKGRPNCRILIDQCPNIDLTRRQRGMMRQSYRPY